MATPQAKGTALVDLVKLARQNVAVFESVLPPATRGVVVQRFLPTSWYPEEHLRDLLVAIDKVRGKGDLQSCVQLGRQSAQKDLSGVYRTGLVAGDPQATLASFPTLWQLYYDTGAVKVEKRASARSWPSRAAPLAGSASRLMAACSSCPSCGPAAP